MVKIGHTRPLTPPIYLVVSLLFIDTNQPLRTLTALGHREPVSSHIPPLAKRRLFHSQHAAALDYLGAPTFSPATV